jgi:hypothetical protein
MIHKIIRVSIDRFFTIGGIVGVVALVGCANGSTPEDTRFAAQTEDEDVAHLTNAVIASPSGTVKIGSDGIATAIDAGTSASAITGAVGSSLSGSSGGRSTAGLGVSSNGISASSLSGGSKAGGVSGAASSSAIVVESSTEIVGASSGGGESLNGSTSIASATAFPGSSASSGSFSVGVADGAVGEDGGTQTGGFGFWHFDDCSPESHFLIDSSGEGANAVHALGGDCVAGISGLGVRFRSAKDIVQVPDEPQFTVSTRVAVAAWVRPDTVAGDQPIVLKRLNDQTSFSLGLHNGDVQMSIVLDNGTTFVSEAPIPAGSWSHVAGMFDGEFLYLFIDGQLFGQVYAAGTLRDVFAPIRIGATTQSQYFHGVIDEVFVSTEDITTSTLTALACISAPSTLTVSPATSPPVSPDTTVPYTVSVQDNDIGFCQSRQYFFGTFGSSSLTVTFDSSTFQTATPGTSAVFDVGVTGEDGDDPGVYEVPFFVEDFSSSNFEDLSGQLTYVIAQPTGCFVVTHRELFITDTSVVDDPVRSPSSVPISGVDGGFATPDGSVVPPPILTPGGPATASPGKPAAIAAATSSDAASADSDAGAGTPGIWTFGHLMEALAPTPAQAPALVEQLFDHWLTAQTVNGFTVAARPAIQSLLLDIWPRTPDGGLDLSQSPLTLQAIVNRIDLRNLSAGSAGEGRFVFAVNDAFGNPQQFTVILEYNLPAETQADVLGWANAWHALGSLPFPSETFNAALEAITTRFAGAGASPSGVNGSALLTLRTNEIALSGGLQWELREFKLSASTGFFDEAPDDETPDLSFNGTSTFADFVNQNAAAIIAEVPGATGVLPLTFEGTNFMAGSVFNNLIEWSAPGIADDDARFHASMNTCNGCHGPETSTTFLMVNPRLPGTEATLSPFLTGTLAFDETNGQERSLNDLLRRNQDLASLVCPAEPDGGASSDASPPPVDAAPTAPIDAGAFIELPTSALVP